MMVAMVVMAVQTVSTATAAVCVGGGKLTEAGWQRCMTEVTEVTESMEVSQVTAAETFCALLLLLSVSVEGH